MNKFAKIVSSMLAIFLCVGLNGCSPEQEALKTQVEDRFDGNVIKSQKAVRLKHPEKFGVSDLDDIPIYLVGTITLCSTIDPRAEEGLPSSTPNNRDCIYLLLQDRKGIEWLMEFEDPYQGLFDKLNAIVNQNVIVLGGNFGNYSMGRGLILHEVDAIILEDSYIRIDDPYGDITDEYVQSFRDQVGFEPGLIEEETEPQYESAQYEEYNYPVSANGRKGDLVFFEAEFKGVVKHDLMYAVLELTQNDGNVWYADLSSVRMKIDLDKIERTFQTGDNVRIYGTYSGATGDSQTIPVVMVDKIVDDSGQEYTIKDFYAE